MRRDDPDRPLRVVSVSRGSRHRDARLRTTLLGREVILERRGTDGDLREAARLYRELAPEVDAFGLGGTDLDLVVAGRRYRIRESAALARHAGDVPVVCGAGLKGTLEARAVALLDERVGWRGRRVLVTLAVDRWGMTEALAAHGADLTLGDLAFGLGVPLPLRSLTALRRVVRVLLPAVVRLPIDWVYPMGERQRSAASDWRARFFEDAEVIAGDYHYVGRYAPEDLSGRIVLTNTTTADDVAMLARRGVRLVATTTPRVDGRSLPTNLLEAAFTAVAGRRAPLAPADLAAMVEEADLRPDVQELAAPAAGPAA